MQTGYSSLSEPFSALLTMPLGGLPIWHRPGVFLSSLYSPHPQFGAD